MRDAKVPNSKGGDSQPSASVESINEETWRKESLDLIWFPLPMQKSDGVPGLEHPWVDNRTCRINRYLRFRLLQWMILPRPGYFLPVRPSVACRCFPAR